MDFEIVNAAPEHVADIERLEKLCFSVPWTGEQIRSQLGGDNHVFIAARSPDSAILGYVGLMHVLDEGYISNVAVDPDCRRMGIADALIGEIVSRANALKLSFVTLEVRESNAPARRLYEKHGFENVGLRKNYYDFPKENAILMTLFLK